jgi:thiamine pyrophosphate-dependent acetolactate synthase large subunit-like protein
MPVTDRSRLRVPALTLATPPQGDANAVKEAGRLLAGAESPLIVVQRAARTPKGWDLVVELAELLQAPVDVGTFGSWQDFPSWHPLSGTGGTGYTPDVTLGLEVSDMSAAARDARAAGRRTISISAEHLYQGSNIHDFGRYAEVDLAIAADAEATLPSLIEEIRRQMTPDRRRTADARRTRVAAAHRAAHERAIDDARYGWNTSPISVPRMIAELGKQIEHDDWAMVSGQQFTGGWQRRLLNFDKHSRYNGDSGGFGIGYDTPASVGAALANKKLGRLSIGIVGDGDLNFGPGVLWTAAHHRIPLLLVVHNNRAYHAEVMIIQRLCGQRGRSAERAHVGTVLTEPNIDHAQLARSYGVYAEGPIERPGDLAEAYRRALERVRAGEPALVDVVAQAR